MRSCNSCGGEIDYINNQTVKCKYCGRLYSIKGDILVDANLEVIYREASGLSNASNESGVNAAIDLFEALGGYKDSAVKAVECKKSIEEEKAAAAERRLEEQRQAELEEIERKKREYTERQKRKITTIAGASAAVICVIVIGIVGSASIRKQTKYNMAVALCEKKNYEEALDVFVSLKDYSDSEDYVVKINALLTEHQNVYSRAKNYYDNEQYGNAIAEFSKCSSYLDSQDYMDKSSEKIYEEAKTAFDADETKKAQELLMTIPQGTSAYNNAQVLLNDVDVAAQEQENARKYEQAIEALDNEQYDSAQELFMALVDYQETRTYLSEIGNWYYGQAQAAYDTGNYPLCGDMVERIDTQEEWSEYRKAVELRDSAKETYQNKIKEEAKNICRTDGNSAMAAYIENAVCSVLDSNEATILKEQSNIKILSLSELEPYGIVGLSGYSSEAYRTDTLGNVYAYTLLGASDIRRGESSNTYYINGQYQYLNATVAVMLQDASSANMAEGVSGIIRIYGDGKLLYSDETIKITTKPYPINVSILGVIDLKIEMYGANSGNLKILLCDPMLSE